MDTMSQIERALTAGIGLADAAARPGRTVAVQGLRGSRRAWGVLVPGPAQRSFAALMTGAERRGAEDLARLRAAAADAVDALLDSGASRATVRRLAASTLVREALDEALAGPLPEDVAERLAAHRVLERMANPLLSADDELVARALGSRFAHEVTDQLLASDEFRQILAHVAGSEDLRVALQAQSAGLADEVAEVVQERTMHVDDALERRARGFLRRRSAPDPVVELPDPLIGRGRPKPAR
jgi:hypothetical protein